MNGANLNSTSESTLNNSRAGKLTDMISISIVDVNDKEGRIQKCFYQKDVNKSSELIV